MARVIHVDARDISSAPRKTSVTASLFVPGTFISIDSNGQVLLADFRASESKPAAVGFLTHGAVSSDPLGTATKTQDRLSFADRGKIGGFTGLTKGTHYYLSSGGGILATKPGTTGDLAQFVGYALTDTVLVVQLGPPTVQ